MTAPTPVPDRRERIAEAIRDESPGLAALDALTYELADAVLSAVRPELEQRDAEIAELRSAVAPGNVELVRRLVHSYSRLVTTERDGAYKRAETAEAERDRLREALALIGTRCEIHTGSKTCVDNARRSRDAVNRLAFGWCNGCIARTALDQNEEPSRG